MKYKIPLIVSYALLTTPLFAFTNQIGLNAEEYELVRNETITQGSADMQVQEPETERTSQSDFLVSIPFDEILEAEDEVIPEMRVSISVGQLPDITEFNEKLQGFYRRDIIALHYLLHHTCEKANVEKTLGLIDEALVDVRDNYIEASYVDFSIYFPYVYIDLKYLTSQKTDYKTKLETYFEANPDSTLVLYTYAQTLQCSVRALPSTCRHFAFVGPCAKKIQHSFLSAKEKPGKAEKQKLYHAIIRKKYDVTFDFGGLTKVKSVGKNFMHSWHNVRQLDFSTWANVREIGVGFTQNCSGLTDFKLGRLMFMPLYENNFSHKVFGRRGCGPILSLTNEAPVLETVITPKAPVATKAYLLGALVRDFVQELQAQARLFLNSPEFPMLCLTITYTCLVYLLDEIFWNSVDKI